MESFQVGQDLAFSLQVERREGSSMSRMRGPRAAHGRLRHAGARRREALRAAFEQGAIPSSSVTSGSEVLLFGRRTALAELQVRRTDRCANRLASWNTTPSARWCGGTNRPRDSSCQTSSPRAT